MITSSRQVEQVRKTSVLRAINTAAHIIKNEPSVVIDITESVCEGFRDCYGSTERNAIMRNTVKHLINEIVFIDPQFETALAGEPSSHHELLKYEQPSIVFVIFWCWCSRETLKCPWIIQHLVRHPQFIADSEEAHISCDEVMNREKLVTICDFVSFGEHPLPELTPDAVATAFEHLSPSTNIFQGTEHPAPPHFVDGPMCGIPFQMSSCTLVFMSSFWSALV